MLFSCSGDAEAGEMVEKVRRTRGESSLSTWRVRRAADARRAVGKGRSMVLQDRKLVVCFEVLGENEEVNKQ